MVAGSTHPRGHPPHRTRSPIPRRRIPGPGPVLLLSTRRSCRARRCTPSLPAPMTNSTWLCHPQRPTTASHATTTRPVSWSLPGPTTPAANSSDPPGRKSPLWVGNDPLQGKTNGQHHHPHRGVRGGRGSAPLAWSPSSAPGDRSSVSRRDLRTSRASGIPPTRRNDHQYHQPRFVPVPNLETGPPASTPKPRFTPAARPTHRMTSRSQVTAGVHLPDAPAITVMNVRTDSALTGRARSPASVFLRRTAWVLSRTSPLEQPRVRLAPEDPPCRRLRPIH